MSMAVGPIGRAVELASLATLAAVFAALLAPAPAAAHYHLECSNGTVTQAVENEAGGHNHADGYVCNTDLYNGHATIATGVQQQLGRCGSLDRNKYLVQAIIEHSGEAVPPENNLDQTLCKESTWETALDVVANNANKFIDWGLYKDCYRTGFEQCSPAPGGSGNPNGEDVYDAVGLGVRWCSAKAISLSYILERGQLPANNLTVIGAGPLAGFNTSQVRNQCWRGWYDSYHPMDISTMREWIRTRATSTRTCGNSQITTAYQQLTGWNPLPEAFSLEHLGWDECDIEMYHMDEEFGLVQSEVNRKVMAAHLCSNPWLGQIWTLRAGRLPNGFADRGECNEELYYGKRGFFNLETPDGYDKLAEAVTGYPGESVKNVFAAHGVSFGSGGQLSIGSSLFPRSDVGIVNSSGDVLDGSGRVIGVGAGNITTGPNAQIMNLTPAPVIAVGAGNAQTVIPPGQVIAVGAGNVIAVGAGNLQGGAIIAVGAGNLIGVGAGNVIAVGAGNLIGVGAGNLSVENLTSLISNDTLAYFQGVGAGHLISDNGSGLTTTPPISPAAAELVPDAVPEHLTGIG